MWAGLTLLRGKFMKRAPLLLVLFVFAACVPTTNGNTPTSPTAKGPTGPTGTATKTDPTAVCEGGASSCSKWLSACKLECKNKISDATKRAECSDGCDDALDECVDACKDSSDPDEFDAKSEDWDGKPEP